ncbi:ribosome assembly RNA-binding protein YhbY [Candidatus Vondammii sp. HM_W22]|uniref:ribosome assembly RNA-binding protein YhbY n=1 Tax=Candidatus Vondammii sp. HM_W22 TaxID=2687299 RepID=UPI001F138096|nr:ribosome assembly RNA-binding protein YhbY [Candidatus Vondammii sp. HM_W22]
MPITKKQKRHLKSLVHHLKPVVIVGQHGLTDGVLAELELTMETHELIKVRVNAADKEERKVMLNNICEKTRSELVGFIGHVAAFYRRHPDKPKISLLSD